MIRLTEYKTEDQLCKKVQQSIANIRTNKKK